MFTLNSQEPKVSRSVYCPKFKNQKLECQNSTEGEQHHANMNRQISHSASGMSLPPFQRILRKCHKGIQTTISFHPKNISSFDTFKQLQKDLTFRDTSYQVIPSEDSVTFQRVPIDQACQTNQREISQPCLDTAMTDEEDVPMYRRQLRNVFDSSFIVAATKKDRSLNPLLNIVKGQKWDTIKSCYGFYFHNVRHKLSVRYGILLYDDRAVISKQLRQNLVDSHHLTHAGQGGMLEAVQNIWYPYLHRDIVATAQNCKECRQKGKNLKVISEKKLISRHWTR